MMRLITAVSALALLSGSAIADDRGMEIRFGVTAHDMADHIEDGPNVTFDLLFESPEFLSFLWSPRPYIYGSFNTEGLTDFYGHGLAWDFELADKVHFELKSGLAYHDGVNNFDLNAPPGDPERIRLATTRALMGSRILFHTAFGLDYDVSDQWSVGAYYEHISHGQILAKGRNQALDNAGIRISYRFGQ
jgi:lipid A 3-O-deacylase